jgi:hypothetical protein
MFSILEMMIVLIGSALLTMQGIKEDIAKHKTFCRSKVRIKRPSTPRWEATSRRNTAT